MPATFNTGAVTPTQVAGVVPLQIFGIAVNWFANRTPLLSRLAKVPDGAPAFQMVGHSYRQRTTTLGAAVADTTGTTITLADASSFLAGDVLRLASGEYVEITVDPNVGANTIAVRRGIGTSTAATQTNGSTVTLVTNTRTGAEDNQTAISSKLVGLTQYMQTIQHPYSVGGGVQTNSLFPLVPGASTPFEQYKMDAMQHCADDAEYAFYSGMAESNAVAGNRPKMAGLQNILVTNNTVAPSDAAAYKATSFQRDLLTKPRKKGGAPSVIVVASNWMDAFSTWGHPLQKLDAGETSFGTPIETYEAPFLGGVRIWEASLLPDFTAFALTPAEVRVRVKRAMADYALAKTGDVEKGMILQELAIEVDNEAHHSYLSGVTAFSA